MVLKPLKNSVKPLPMGGKENRVLWIALVCSLAYTALIYLLGYRLASVPHAPDTGVSHYFWKLIEPTFASRLSVWGLYLGHQVALWWCIFYAQKNKLKYTSGLHPVNIWALAINGTFALLHVLQTHLFYDGLAQDVSIFSSQGSVIVLLVWVLLMENNRRGMFFGKKLPVGKAVMQFARTYHGYFFAWAIIFTFWYHPTEATVGHLWGFFYTALLMAQSSLMFTRAHLNRWWTFFLEFTVLIHGTLVAVAQGNGIWPMFCFGFGGIFVITQMHGLKLSRFVRAGLLGFYIAAVLWVYNSRGWDKLNEIIRIPVIDYLAVVVLALLFALGLRIAKVFKQNKSVSV